MRIGIPMFVLEGGKSGLAAYTRNLLRALQLRDTKNQYDLLMARDDSKQVPLIRPNFTKRLYPSALNHPLLSLAWHNLGLPQNEYDLLHIPSARRIPLIKRTRIVATVHDLAAFSVDGKYDRARMLFNRQLVPAMIRRADRVIAISEHTKNDLVRFVGYPEEKISVIHSGINHDLFHPVPANEARQRLAEIFGLEKPFFVYVARLEHPAKNHVRLIKAFERFKQKHDSPHQLVLAGAEWGGADIIRAHAAASPVKEDIIFPGFVPDSQLPLLYNGCDLMVFPSLFEGFGFPVLEALACGAPVICSNTSALQELVGNRVPTFDPIRPEAIFRCLEAAASAGCSEDARNAGMEYAKTFTWRKTARSVMKVYRSAME